MWQPIKVFLLCIGLITFSGAAGAETLVKLSHQWRQGDTRDEVARYFAKEVERRAPDLKFRVYPARSLISDPIAQYDALVSKTIDMAIYPLAYAEGKVPEYSIGGIPGLIRSLEHARRLKGTPFADKLQEIANENGVHIMAWWWVSGGFASKGHEIKGPETVEGLRVRGGGRLFEAALAAAGASVQSMPSTEIYPALQTGVIDTVLTSADSFMSMRLYELTTNATIGENLFFYAFIPLLVSKQFWDELTPEQRQALNEAATLSETFFMEKSLEADQRMIETFTKAGTKVRPLKDDEYDAWLEISKRTAWELFAEETKRGRELLDLASQVK